MRRAGRSLFTFASLRSVTARLLRFAAAMGVCCVLLSVRVRAEETAIRVVSQTVGTDELLLALADPAQVAALSHLSREDVYSAVADEAKQYPMLEKQGDVEGILKFRPTLVLFANYSRAELVSQVRRAGVKAMIFERYRTLDDAYENLRILGRELGASDKAEKLIAECQARVVQLEEKLRAAKPVRVIAPSTYGLIPGDDSTFQDLCDHAAAENLAATRGGLHGHEAPPNEQMLLWPIDKVVVAGTSVESALAPYKKLPPYQFMSAVQENRAALLKPYQLSCVSHHRIKGYEQLARELHPELFP
jgi:iron complex transport system substrate-binding protein